MIDPQVTFDTVVSALRKQGCKSLTPNPEGDPDRCAYRGLEGAKCAIGHLIPDAVYHIGMEDLPVYYLGDYIDHMLYNQKILEDIKNTPTDKISPTSVGQAIEGHDLKLARALQLIHDECSLDRWEKGFQEVAETFGLRYTGDPSS